MNLRFNDINFFFRTRHLSKLADELKDPEASDNDRFVIYTHLQNAVVAAAGQLPSWSGRPISKALSVSCTHAEDSGPYLSAN